MHVVFPLLEAWRRTYGAAPDRHAEKAARAYLRPKRPREIRKIR